LPRQSEEPGTIFDLLFDRYLPFRLYAEFMLGTSIQDLSERFTLSEQWIEERIEALRLCLRMQVRLHLFDTYYEPEPDQYL
ncbi:MAG TPA: hypothetical protein VE641_02405, partial [Chthoniobacterales bacterium]|nr:hypothetical protein [Chthoniobacterales bacterium]